MKASEIAKYLSYADDEIDFKLITTEEYEALWRLAHDYVTIVTHCAANRSSNTKDINLLVRGINGSTKRRNSEKTLNEILWEL